MYFLDSNAFLTPALSYYAFDICGGYWDWLADAASAGHIASIDRVKRELRVKDDQIKHWIDFHASHLFQGETASISSRMTEVASWAAAGHYAPAATGEFLGKADAFLVAHAKDCGGVVVSFETREPRRTNKVKIPDACDAHGVNCITPFELLRRHGVRLIR